MTPSITTNDVYYVWENYFSAEMGHRQGIHILKYTRKNYCLFFVMKGPRTTAFCATPMMMIDEQFFFLPSFTSNGAPVE
jgi:hypothetical protein